MQSPAFLPRTVAARLATVFVLTALILGSRHAPADDAQAPGAAPSPTVDGKSVGDKPADSKADADAARPADGSTTPASPTSSSSQATAKKPLSKDPPGMKRLSPEYDAWIDIAKKRVVLDGTVCLQRGTLELLACIKGTKEHESVISVDCRAYIIHAALLAVGAKSGTPVRWQPKFESPTGTPIEIMVIWTDPKGVVQRQNAKQWVRDVRTQKPLQTNWVFAGSRVRDAGVPGASVYEADEGDFICVSNFPSAMLDLPIESSKDNSELMFEAFTENIPPRGTRVRMVLTPQLEKAP